MIRVSVMYPTTEGQSFDMDYYINKLGFTKKWDWGDPPTFGCVARDKVSIFLCEATCRE